MEQQQKECINKLTEQISVRQLYYSTYFVKQYGSPIFQEIIGVIMVWLNFGPWLQRQEACFAVIKELKGMPPLMYIQNEGYIRFMNSDEKLHRELTWGDFAELCKKLHIIYQNHESLESALIKENSGNGLKALINIFGNLKGFSTTIQSPCEKFCTLLRWMVRKTQIDVGIWNFMTPNDLLVSLDKERFYAAQKLGLTKRKTNDMKTVAEVTKNFRQFFPFDPSKGDYVLDEYLFNNKKQKLI